MQGHRIRKKLIGTVTRDSVEKTTSIIVERLTKHKKYKKYIKKRSKYMVHDPKNICKMGDTVRVIESRPISKLKRWYLLEII